MRLMLAKKAVESMDGAGGTVAGVTGIPKAGVPKELGSKKIGNPISRSKSVPPPGGYWGIFDREGGGWSGGEGHPYSDEGVSPLGPSRGWWGVRSWVEGRWGAF